MPQVEIPSAFFESELRLYGSWRHAVAREIISNSFDAGASEVHFEVGEATDGAVQLVAADNGCGMTRQVLDDCFFQLGQSTKHGDDTIGGFGRARIIVAFAQRRYAIDTGLLRVEGAGGTYDVFERTAPFDGCRFTIDLIDSNMRAMETAIEETVATCSHEATVTLNSRELETYKLPSRATRQLVDDDGRMWARVYVVKDQRGKMLVRAGGVVMFDQNISGLDDVVVEIPARLARTVLAANRDRLVAPYAAQLDEFIQDLVRNRSEALRTRDEPLQLMSPGFGFRNAISSGRDDLTGEHDDTEPASVGEGRPVLFERNADVLRRNVNCDADTAPVPSRPDVYLLAADSTTTSKRLARKWDPGRWSETSRQWWLLSAWEVAVEAALEALFACSDLEEIIWAPGFVFDADTCAQHNRLHGGHVLSLNPIRNGKQLRNTNKDDARAIVAYAMHEAAHVVVPWHDESYAGLLTEMVAVLDSAATIAAVRAARG